MNLTNMAVTNAKPKSVAYKMTDDKGLYLKVWKTGGKSWRYDFRLAFPDGKTKNSTFYIGLYPDVSLAKARELHAKAHRLVSQGIDPNEDKKEQNRQHWSQILRYGVAIEKAERDFTHDIRDALATQKTKHHPALEPHETPEFLHALEHNDARLYPQNPPCRGNAHLDPCKSDRIAIRRKGSYWFWKNKKRSWIDVKSLDLLGASPSTHFIKNIVYLIHLNYTEN